MKQIILLNTVQDGKVRLRLRLAGDQQQLAGGAKLGGFEAPVEPPVAATSQASAHSHPSSPDPQPTHGED